MSQTTVRAGTPGSNKLFNAGLFLGAQQVNHWSKMLTGPVSTQGNVETEMARQQSSEGYPITQVRDLSKTAGLEVEVNLFDIPNGPPIPGDRNAEGKGDAMTMSTMNLRIGQQTFAVDAGGNMAQKATPYQLKSLAKTSAINKAGRFRDQSVMTMISGSAGTVYPKDTVVYPNHPDFAELMVNAVEAPSYNRHFVVDGTDIKQGGINLATIDSTDLFKLEHLDYLGTWLESEPVLKPVMIADDNASSDSPIYVMQLSPYAFLSLEREAGAQTWRQWQADAMARKTSSGSRHPLFNREAVKWGNLYMVKAPRSVRFAQSTTTKYVAAADRLSGTQLNNWRQTETDVVINAALGANFFVERIVILGAQALAEAYGSTAGGDYMDMGENKYDYERKSEFAVWQICGRKKIKFGQLDPITGQREATDNGIVVVDVAAKRPVLTA
jgi:N4-gp56 family major capsid protein